MSLSSILKVKQRAEILYTEAQLQPVYERMATEISRDMAELSPTILCAMNGGLMLTAELLKRVDFPLRLDYVGLTRYHGETRGSELIWLQKPGAGLQGQHVLIVDDILDEGITLAAVQEACRSTGVASLATVVLAVKQHDRRTQDIPVEYRGITVPDRYVFGCGMDYLGYFRNLPDIYAVSEHEENMQ